MNTESTMDVTPGKTPWHLWVIGVLALLWNCAGAYTIMMSQAGKLTTLSAEEAEYYAAQPLWLVVATDIALLSAIAAAVMLLLRSRWAVWLFALSLGAIVVTDLYDLAAGSSRVIISTGALIATAVIFLLAVLELLYARAMMKRAVLR